jgi:hypothetical protein
MNRRKSTNRRCTAALAVALLIGGGCCCHKAGMGCCAHHGCLGGADQIPPPVVARLHPVPTQPVFCPRDEAPQPIEYSQAAQTANNATDVASDTKTLTGPQEAAQLSALRQNSGPQTARRQAAREPAGIAEVGATTPAPRQLNAPPEASSWIFSNSPQNKSEAVAAAELPPWPSDRATRR